MNAKEIWQAVLGELEVSLSKANFTTWFKNTFIISINDDLSEIVIGVPNNFTKRWLEEKYHKEILKALQRITDDKVKKVMYQVGTPKSIEQTIQKMTIIPAIKLPKLPTLQPVKRGFKLNKKYILANFIVGQGNELAYAASQAVVSYPGKKYNPLFIYGDVGLGKTHLLQAIAWSVSMKRKKYKVLYTTAEKFTNEFIEAIRNGKIEQFKNIYRDLDFLLIDDVQFFTGKVSTQGEFFHTYEALYQKNKQIVLASDRPPQAIAALEKRLVSRFHGGMMVNITQPNLETRMAILISRAQEKRFIVSKEIIRYIAENVTSNVRELEGTLNRIIAYFELSHRELTLELVKQILSSMATTQNKKLISSKELLNQVAKFYDIKVSDLTGKSRKKEIVVPRQIAMYLLREELDLSFPMIGHNFGGRDHTTVIHAYKKIKNKLQVGGRIKQEIELIKDKLYTVIN
ncbi:MAG: chromosomal replication initiator protein DnaA [Candidatus Aenigmarchaeota archaeon]|nr:chromosomal replication initiator protein DnaA [Candidatus Aenigmarchaeota archaeon]